MSSTAVKRACDACHRRKVKCDGINPCRNCSSAQLSCTYLAIPQKKGPKGSRAKVISELRENQRQTSLSAKVQNHINGISNPPTAPTLAPTPGLLTPDVVKDCRDFFFNNMYPIMPILHRERLEQQTMYMDTSIDTYCLITSMCAFMMLQPGMNVPGLAPGNDAYGMMPGANILSASLLLEETIRCRKGYDYLDSPSHNAMCTSYFLFAYYYALQSHDKAWYHLREATTLAHMMGMNKEEKYVEWDSAEGSRRKRLFWLLFVTERAYALQRGRPLTLQATLSAPTISDDPNDPQAHQLHNFVTLVNLFRPFDDSFVNLWNKTVGDCSGSLGSLQKQFGEVVPVLLNNNSQLTDLHANQSWLKDLSWRILNHPRNEVNINYQYDAPREALAMMSSFATQGINLMGAGLIEKLLDITASLTEFLHMQPASRVSYEDIPRQNLGQVLNIVALIRSEQQHFIPLLLSKVHSVLPGLVNPMLQNAPETAPVCNVDLFDDVFGQSSGMQQQACFPTEEYEIKFPVEFKTEPGNPLTSGPPPTDRSSSYVSSPTGVVSPGMDIGQGLPSTDFSPMPDMVMSPMGHTPGGMNTQQQHQHQHQHQQHQQHRPMTTLQSMTPGINVQMQHNMSHSMSPSSNMTLNGQSLDQSQPMHGVFSPGGVMSNGMNSMNSMNQNMNGNSMLMRQQPQRANTFAMSQQFRVGDFQALQRTNTDMGTLGSMGMNTLGTELDFNTLR